MSGHPRPSGIRQFIAELQRRHVLRVAGVYAVLGWAVMQVADTVLPALQVPGFGVTIVVVLVLLGFPLTVGVAWAFDLTSDGFRRTGALPDAAATPLPSSTDGPTAVAAAAAPPPPAPPRAAGLALSGRTVVLGVPIAAPSDRAAPAEMEALPPDPDRVYRASLSHLRHELRTPINAILGYSEMLLEDAGSEAGGPADDLRRIHSAGGELLRLVDEILHPDRISSGPTRDLEAFQAQLRADLRDPANAVVGYAEMLIESAEEHGWGDMVPDLERIRSAARRMVELMDEIVEFPAGEARDASRSTEMARAEALAQEVLAKIRPLTAGEAEVELRQGSLLVVDDNAMNRDLLSRQLARQGYTVSTAEGGREALELLEAQAFDLVLLDIMMPEVDGLEVLRRMQADGALCHIPVIMISAMDEVDSIVRCIAMGAADYVAKPFDPVLLAARIGTILEARRMASRERELEAELGAERAASDQLLASVVPGPVAERVRRGERTFAAHYPEVTVVHATLDGTGKALARGGAAALVECMAQVLAGFDAAARRHAVEIVRFAGFTYVAVVGAPAPRADHADAAAGLALALLREVERLATELGHPLRLRVGIHTGPAVAGMIAGERLTFEVWGDAVDLSAGLAAQCAPEGILVSPVTYARLRDRFHLESRGVLEVAGKGQVRAYQLLGSAVVEPHAR